RKRNPCMIGTGAMCDPYIDLEEKLQITRKCLELIKKYGFGLAIQTKSNLILRDLDILKKINLNTKCVVQMTLTTYDEKLCRIIEPNVSTTYERFKVLEIMRDEGIPTVVWMTPILPFITDSEENLMGILDYCKKAEVRGILTFGFGMTLREGNREYFYKMLDKKFPGVKSKYIKHYGNKYVCLSPENEKLKNIFYKEFKNHGILTSTDKIFNYIQDFESKKSELTLF
ncbi:MAG: radical SAM protein, partial [Candidatus Muiribacteriota bacterium]